MAAHRRQRAYRIPGLVRFSAVSLTVATAAFATACGANAGKGEHTENAAAFSAPDLSAPESPAGTVTVLESGAPTPSASAGTSAAPTPSASVSASAAARAAAAAAPAGAAAKPAAKSPSKPAASKPAPAPKTSTPTGGGSAKGSSGFTPGYREGANVSSAVKAAIAAAKADGKKVLIDFGANWCGNCKAADKVFGGSTVGGILDSSYHVVKADIDSNFDVLRKYSPSTGEAYKMPVLVILDGNGKVVTETHSTGNPPLTNDGLGAFLRKWA
ncbi:thioredoxin family protein [Streptomyces sp. NBC_01264]|uniref:thioredoxin family protein n=1 Tax=Streptomyces sp. NBC_01264 TaxID=2903804 RepID=UPI00225B2F37|nr:thioredoxin family protein [Streptomyces sp. NBC_01264]MCX4781801.1 thioredoxin family protein [Streptomyces sp. NBC_01264]